VHAYLERKGEFLSIWSSGGYSVDVGRAGVLAKKPVE